MDGENEEGEEIGDDDAEALVQKKGKKNEEDPQSAWPVRSYRNRRKISRGSFLIKSGPGCYSRRFCLRV